MTNEIMRRVADVLLTPAEAGGLSRRDARELQRAVDRQAAAGIVRAAGVQADGYVSNTVVETADFVADTGLSRTARLSRREAPLGEAQYRAIVDTYASLVAREVAKSGTHGRLTLCQQCKGDSSGASIKAHVGTFNT